MSDFIMKRTWFVLMVLIVITGWLVFIHLLKLEERFQDRINKALIDTNIDLGDSKKTK
ncbi:MAG: hypothetical protein V1893_00365 [Candidatus Omnitrophota bacterium]